ncbi:MAG: lysophospholipid acyltransferase family protein [Burkholderiaceae bacterium]
MRERALHNRPLWTLYEHVAMFVGLGSLALLCLIWLPFAMLLYPLLPRHTGQALGRRAIAATFALYLRLLAALCACRFDLSELDALRDAGPLIIAANHPSLLDAVLIVSRLPNAVCVMKSSLMDNLLFGSAARLARYIRNDNALQMIGNSREALQAGAQLVMFPEGTRTRQFPLDPLSPTLAMVARRSGAPVQTVLLEFSSPYLGKAWRLWRKPCLPLYCRARLGRRFEACGDHALLTRELEAYFRLQLPSTRGTAAAAND